MTNDELIETVAQAICCESRPCEARCNAECNKRFFIDAARAAIDVVAEECAKAGVAAVNSCREDGESDMRAARSRVEQRIRALKQGDGE